MKNYHLVKQPLSSISTERQREVISNLEDQLAITLFDRVGRSVEPTEDGHLLYHYAKKTVEQARIFENIALSLSFGGLERVVIAYSSFMPPSALFMIRNSERFSDHACVELLVRDRAEIKRGIVDGSIHFGLVNVHESSAMHSMDSVFRPRRVRSLCSSWWTVSEIRALSLTRW